VPPPGQPDPEGDEITNTLCAQIGANFQPVTYLLNQILIQMQQGGDDGGGDNGGGLDACCTAVVAAISSVTASLAQIFNLLAKTFGGGGTPGPPVDLSQVVKELDCICKALQALTPTDLTPVVAALEDINTTLAAIQQCICDMADTLKKLVPDSLIDGGALLREMVKETIISQNLATVLDVGGPGQ
jgi:hypothetical protein